MWVTLSPPSFGFSFALVRVVYFKVRFIENICALFDLGSEKSCSMAFKLVFLHSVWFSAVLSCRWKLEEKESSYVKLIWILCTCGADFVLLPWAFHFKPPLTRANPFLDSERTWTKKVLSSFWKIVCYFFSFILLLFSFCFWWMWDALVSSMWQYCVILPLWAWLALTHLWPAEFRTFRFPSVCSSTP